MRALLTHRIGGQASLRQQLAIVIAVLSILPNAVVATMLVLPLYRRAQDLSSAVLVPLAVWMLGVVSLAVLIGYLLSYQLLAPLNRMSTELRRLPKGPKSLAEAKLTETDSEPEEVSALRASFNDLLGRVQRERSRRDAFMAAVMHDLKTPLVASSHLLGVLRDGGSLDPGERLAVIDHLLRENDVLVNLVQQLVDAHRFERAGVSLQVESADVDQVVLRTVQRVAPLADERGVTIDVEGSAIGQIDSVALERALYNLLANAVRYANSHIRVSIYSGVIRISDDGPGLPAPLEVLAQPFRGQPVAIAGQHFTAGSGGLGLYIAKSIVEAHGGRMVEEGSTLGTTLLIYLPKEGVA